MAAKIRPDHAEYAAQRCRLRLPHRATGAERVEHQQRRGDNRTVHQHMDDTAVRLDEH